MLKSNKWFWAAALAFTLAGLPFFYSHITNDSLEEAAKTSETIISRMRTRSVNHGFVVDNDVAKSLVRLLDKARGIAWREADLQRFNTESLREQLIDQRLTGAVILDDKMRSLLEVSFDDFPWHDIIERPAASDVLKHPVKQFADRIILSDGAVYDFGVVARRAGKGMVLAWTKKDLKRATATTMDLYPGDAFALESLIFVVRGGTITATNAPGWVGQSMKECYYLTPGSEDTRIRGFKKIKVRGETWYGRKLMTKGNLVYVMMPAKAVFAERNATFLEIALLWFGILAAIYVVQQRTGRRYAAELSTQYETVKSISSLYSANYLVRLEKDELVILKGTEAARRIYTTGMGARQFFRLYLTDIVAPEQLSETMAFCDPSTMASRLATTSHDEMLVSLKDGRWLQLVLLPQRRDAEKRIIACLVIARDVSDARKKELQTQTELKVAVERAESAAGAKVQFLRHMSHDVRTPINGIRGMVELARKAPGDAERQTYCLEKIWTVSGTLLELVNDVLDMSKLDAGGERLENVPFDLADLMDEILATTAVIAKKQGVRLEHYMHGEGWRFVGSRKHLRRICTNIIFNAVKFTPEGGAVTFGCRRGEAEADGRVSVVFECRDTGRGMSEEFQKHLFEPFTQEDQAAARTTYQGTGLGLVITKQLTELLGGTITFKSELSRGTTFTVTVPLAPDETQTPTGAMKTEATVADISGMKVLLVEDNDLNLEIARFLLEDAGVDVTMARNGAEAVEVFKASEVNGFDVILMDIMMPVMNGLEATKAIRALKRSDATTVPIIAMTANAFDDDIDESFKAGMNGHFTKPLDNVKLMQGLGILRARQLSVEDGVPPPDRSLAIVSR